MKTGFVKDRMNEIGNLGKNEVRIIAVRPTKVKEKVQVVFLQNIEREGRVNLLAEANAGDESFAGQTNARPFWITFTLKGLGDMFPTLVEPAKTAIKNDDYVAVDIKNPMHAQHNRPVCIQVVETHRARTRDLDNLEQSAKQDGQGNFLSKDGLMIFERDILTFKDVAQHVFIEHDRNALTKDLADLDLITSEYEPTPEEEKASTAQNQQQEIVDEDEPVEEETEVPA